MKKFLLLLAFAGLLLNGCSETDVDKTPTFAFGKNLDLTPEINPKGESLTFDFVSQFDWQTTVSEDWISIEPESGTAQDKSITVTFQPNKTGEARTGSIIITLSNEESFYISVSQESEDVVFVDADKPYQIGYEGGEITIAISTNAEYTVDIPEEAQVWLRLADTRAYREEKLSFVVLENEEYSPRSAVVRLWDAKGLPLNKFRHLYSRLHKV